MVTHINLNTMKNEQILNAIKVEEQRLYDEYLELREAFGNDDRATRYASAQWNAVLTLLEQIENETI